MANSEVSNDLPDKPKSNNEQPDKATPDKEQPGKSEMRQVVLICAVLAALLPTSAETAERVWRIGVLAPVGESSVQSVILPYLATRGFVEGRNLVVDLRTGTEIQMAELAQVMVAGKPDAIIAESDWAILPVRAATSIIPIVAAPMGADPVLAGVAESWAHPGGNVTGVSLIASELELKRLSLLREVLPSVHRIAVLSNHRKVVEAGFLPLRKAAAQLGLELVEIWVESPNEYAAAFARMRGDGAEAVVIVPTPELYRDTEQLAALAAKTRLPAIGGFRESAQRGLLIGYGPNLRELDLQAAGYVERILNGAQAGELPFQGPTHLDFAINMRTARALGLTIPPSLLVGADEVIE